MKKTILFYAVILLLACGYAQADNNIMIMVNEITTSTYDIPVGFENDVALQGVTNGLRISASGGLVAYFIKEKAYIDTISRGGVLLQQIYWNFRYAPWDTEMPDTVLGGFWKKKTPDCTGDD